MSQSTTSAGPEGNGEEPQLPPDLLLTAHRWSGLDRLGLIEASGGLAIGLIPVQLL